jgi:hypothetical protein
VTETEHALSLLAPAGSGNNARILKKSAPSTPYTITVVLTAGNHAVNYNFGGVCFRQSSDGKLVLWGVMNSTLISYKYSDPSTYNSTYTLSPATSPAGMANRPIVLRIEDDGTNRKLYWSPDGITFLQMHSVGRTDYLTADEVGIVADSNNSTHPCVVTLYSWEQA